MKAQKHIVLLVFLSFFVNWLSAQRINFDFVENKGQWNSDVRFMGDIGSGAFYLRKNGFTVLLNSEADLKKLHQQSHGIFEATAGKGGGAGTGDGAVSANAQRSTQSTIPASLNNDSFILHSHAYKVDFEGASSDVEILPGKAEQTVNNYFIGNDPSKWASACRIFGNIVYKNLYPGIDLRYYSENGALKYDLVINPGANPDNILMKYDGVEKLSVNKNNQLVIKTSVGDVTELEPFSYQFDNEKGRNSISCRYEIVNGNAVRFKIKSYARNLPLVIDPTVIFTSFSGSRTDNWGFTATPGPDGSLFGAGIVQQNGYPVSPGAVQSSHGGGVWDVGLTRFSPDGTSRIYSTYIGGSESDFPLSMISDPQGDLVMMGRTYSPNFPGDTVGKGGGADLFVLKLNPTGTAFIGCLKIGGAGLDACNMEDQRIGNNHQPVGTLRFYGDDSRGEVILDKAGNIYVATQTQSDNFPLVNPFQASRAGGQDGAILKLNPTCKNIIFSSYLGGGGNDGVFVMDISPTTGNLYVGGSTASSDFPGDKTGVIHGSMQGGATDGFVTELSSAGAGIIRTTFLGTPNYDAVYGLKFDKLGYPYVMGISEGSWPVINATFSNPGSKQFVAKLQPDLSAFVYSTVYGSNSSMPNISPVAFLVDRCENVYVSGWGGSILPAPSSENPYNQAGTSGMPTTAGAIKSITDNKDFYFIVIRKNAASLLYGSFFGQGGAGPSGYGEHVDGGTSRYDQQGVIYQAICANCEGNSFGTPNPGFPTTPGVVGPVNGAGDRGCNLGVVKIAFNFAGVGAGLRAYINGVYDTVGCVPLTFEFRDTVRNAQSYEWNFGDGSSTVATTDFHVNHTYNNIGVYKVMLVGIDSTTCNVRDTVYINVQVKDNQAFLGFNAAKLPPCESLSYQFNNTSTLSATAQPYTGKSFVWDFGDGSSRVVAGLNSITHSYAAAGTYNVRLVLADSGYCNSPDSMLVVLRVAPLVKARIETSPVGCIPYTAVFKNTSQAGSNFIWDFGDGTTSTDGGVTVTHTYTTANTFIVKLVAIDTSTCNKIDSTTTSIVASDKPTAAFTYSPLTPQENFPYTFTNTSSADATRFKWLYGDGDTLLTTSRADVEHQYNSTGNFNVLLVAANSSGCLDTARARVASIIVPKLDLPNAFTPGSNSVNGIIYVRGFGITKMLWRIYNRFGQLVFESSSTANGWDGKYKGVLQPMDAYAYTLVVEFSDGTRTTKKGDITLLR